MSPCWRQFHGLEVQTLALSAVYSITDSKLFPKPSETRAYSSLGLHTTHASLAYKAGGSSPFTAIPAPCPSSVAFRPLVVQHGWWGTIYRDCQSQMSCCCCWVLVCTTKYIQAFMTELQIHHFLSATFLTSSDFKLQRCVLWALLSVCVCEVICSQFSSSVLCISCKSKRQVWNTAFEICLL